MTTSADTVDLGIEFDNTFARLPDRLFERVAPTPVKNPSLLALNHTLCKVLGLDPRRLSDEAGLAVLAGNRHATGSDALAMAYAGHQFGHWVPQLGDGRALMLGERVGSDGTRWEIQLKGAGRTPFSRGGDGRAALGPVLREFILSEAMHALGVPTTRALAAVATGESVIRESALPGAIVVRVARSHIRVGTFQYFTARQDIEAVQALMQHVLEHHFADLQTEPRPALALLEAAVQRQAALVAQWMSIGFVHGVMNTDNCCVVGDTIDYGPAAFLDEFRADKVFSSIDVQGRYAWGRQPSAAHWNLGNLAQCLLPLIDDDREQAIALAQACVDTFEARFHKHWGTRLAAKIGLEGELGEALGNEFLGLLQESQADFTQAYTSLRRHHNSAETRALFADHAKSFDDWWTRRQSAMQQAGVSIEDADALMRQHNPVRIPRNHQIQAVIDAAEGGDLEPLHALRQALQSPYVDDTSYKHFEAPPNDAERVRHTFCGT